MYILEGNIGAGKSTFLKLVGAHFPSLKIILEPLHNWQKKASGQSLLSHFYQKPTRWAYTLETLAMIYRIKDHLAYQNDQENTIIMERSVYSGHYCFAYNSHQNGFLTDLEWEMYKRWFHFLVEDSCKPPHGFIYLQTSPEISYKRIKKRNRAAEKNLSFDYIQKIHQRHEDILIHKKDVDESLKEVPVLILNCDEEFETNNLQFHKHLQTLEAFLNQINTSNRQEIKHQPSQISL